MTLLNATSFTAAGTVNVNNVFSSDYLDYKLLLSLTTASPSPDVNFRLRAGTDNSVNYNRTGISTVFNSTTITVTNQVGTTSGFLFAITSGREISADITISNPAITSETILTWQASGLAASAVVHYQAGMLHDVPSAFDGFTLFTSTGTITGNLRVYGLRK
jgi:hypothetical protein